MKRIQGQRKEVVKEEARGRAEERAERRAKKGVEKRVKKGRMGGAQMKKTPVPSMEITCWICHGLYFSDK